MKFIKYIAAFLFMTASAYAQSYSTLSWGLNKATSPYPFGINLNSVWYNLGTVSSSGSWAIPVSNIYNGSTPLLASANTWSSAQNFSGGATIPFKQNGSLSIYTTVDAKLKTLWVSVTDFCTSAQIANDISSCAQNAINAIAAFDGSYGGGVLYFPSQFSPYVLKGTLYLNNNFLGLVGDDTQGSYIQCNNGGASCIVIGNASLSTRNQFVKDIGIFGQSKTGGANIQIYASTYNTLIQRVQLEGCPICLDVGPGTNNTTIRDAILIPNAIATPTGIYWHAPGDGSSRSDVLSLFNVTIDGQWTSATGLLMDGLVQSTSGSSIRMINMSIGLRIINSANSSLYYPSFVNWHDFEAEGFKLRAVSIEAGTEIKIINSDMTNLSGNPSQGGSDDYAVLIQPDTAGSRTRGVLISNSRIGISKNSGVYNGGTNVMMSNILLTSTNIGVSAPAIESTPSSSNSVFNGIICREYGSSGTPSGCVVADGGSTNIVISNTIP